jgi:heme exporter protein D
MLEAFTPWWPDWAAFLQMGRHGAYVWSAFGICAVAVACEAWALRRQARALHAAHSTEGPHEPD